MEHEANPYSDPSSAPPVGSPARWAMPRVPRAAVAVGITAFLGLAGAGAAVALTGSGGSSSAQASSSSSPSTPANPTPVPGPRGMDGPFGRPMGPYGGNVVHGQYTVNDGSGYRTIDVQVGKVTAVSSTSITVQSTDNFSQQYTVKTTTEVDSQAGGISAVSTGDQVRIEAEAGSGQPTAVSITDTTKIGDSRQSFGFHAPGRWSTAPSTSTPAA